MEENGKEQLHDKVNNE